jgi:LacI family transcriptional regulator
MAELSHPTLQALATSLGLSKATVSRALSGRGRLSETTRARVRAAAAAAGFVPSRAALSLTTGRTGLVGLVIGANRTPVALAVMTGVVEAATAEGWQVVVHISATDAEDAAIYRTQLAGQSVDGVIHQFPTAAACEALRALARRGTPVVAIDPETAAPGVPTLRADAYADGRAATRHLIAQGHRRIGLAGDLPGWGVQDRLRDGWAAALAEAGLAADPALACALGWTHAAGAAATARLCALPDPATAAIYACDVAALGGLAWLAAQGLRVPRDFALVGYDDTEMAAWVAPALTAPRARREGLARLAWQRLAAQLRGEAVATEPEDIATGLALRPSSGG